MKQKVSRTAPGFHVAMRCPRRVLFAWLQENGYASSGLRNVGKSCLAVAMRNTTSVAAAGYALSTRSIDFFCGFHEN